MAATTWPRVEGLYVGQKPAIALVSPRGDFHVFKGEAVLLPTLVITLAVGLLAGLIVGSMIPASSEGSSVQALLRAFLVITVVGPTYLGLRSMAKKRIEERVLNFTSTGGKTGSDASVPLTGSSFQNSFGDRFFLIAPDGTKVPMKGSFETKKTVCALVDHANEKAQSDSTTGGN